MKLTKYLVSSAAAIAVAGTLSIAYAQTTTPAAGSGNNATAVQQPQGAGTLPNRTTDIATPGTMSSGTAATTGMMNSGTAATTDSNNTETAATGTMDSQSTASTNRRAGKKIGTRTNSDGTMSTERVARADRG